MGVGLKSRPGRVRAVSHLDRRSLGKCAAVSELLPTTRTARSCSAVLMDDVAGRLDLLVQFPQRARMGTPSPVSETKRALRVRDPGQRPLLGVSALSDRRVCDGLRPEAYRVQSSRRNHLASLTTTVIGSLRIGSLRRCRAWLPV